MILPKIKALVAGTLACTSNQPSEGNFYYFLREPGPVGLGHMGWGLKVSNHKYLYGSMENPDGVPFVGRYDKVGYWVKSANSEAEMLRQMRTMRAPQREDSELTGVPGYTRYKKVKVAKPNLSAVGKAITDQQGYSVVGNNCLDNAAKVSDAYGAKDVASWQRHVSGALSPRIYFDQVLPDSESKML